MKNCLLLLLGIFCYTFTFGEHFLKYKTPVPIVFISAIHSNHPGNVAACMAQDIKDESGTYVLIAKGTPVLLNIRYQKSRGIGKPGQLEIHPLYTHSVDGQPVLLDGKLLMEGKKRNKLALGLGIGCGLTCLPVIGFSFLLLQGEAAVIPSGTVTSAFFTGTNYAITFHNN